MKLKLHNMFSVSHFGTQGLLFVMLLALPLLGQTYKLQVVTGEKDVVSVKIDTTKKMIVSKRKYERMDSTIRDLKLELRLTKKALNKHKALQQWVQRKYKISHLKATHLRVYFVTCAKDTSALHTKYGISVRRKWDSSRANVDSTCRVIEKWVKKGRLKAFKKARRAGLIKVLGVWPKMKALYKYLNDPTNGFVRKEEQIGTKKTQK